MISLLDVRNNKPTLYRRLNFSLYAARQDMEVDISGTFMYVFTYGVSNLGIDFGNQLASIKFNETTADSIDLFNYQKIKLPFYRFFLTNQATGFQDLNGLVLVIGADPEDFEMEFNISPWPENIRNILAGYARNFTSSAVNGTTLIHQVPGTSMGILEYFNLEGDNTGAVGLGSLFVTDAVDTTLYVISALIVPATTGAINLTGNPNTKINPLEKIKIISSQAGFTIRANIKIQEMIL